MEFIATKNKGFRIKFKNGLAVSVQWGTMNYCERRSLNITKIDAEQKEDFVKSSTAEVALFDENDHFISIGENDAVVGWVNPDQVARIIACTQAATDTKELKKEIKKFLKEDYEALYE
jgi:hypothetical protein